MKEALAIPVIGNGDVTTPQEAKQMMAETGCDAVMIGRAARGNPWIFSQTVTYFRTGAVPSEPTPADRIRMALSHIEKAVAFYGERTASLEMKKHAAWYVRHIREGSATSQAYLFHQGYRGTESTSHRLALSIVRYDIS